MSIASSSQWQSVSAIKFARTSTMLGTMAPANLVNVYFVVFAAKGLALPEQPEQSHYSAATSRQGQSLLRNPHNKPYHNPKLHNGPKAFHPVVCRDIWGDLPPIQADTFDVVLPDHCTAGALNNKTRWFSQYTGYAANTTHPRRYAGLGHKEALTSSLSHDAKALPAALAKYYPKHTNVGSKLYSRTNPDQLVPTVLTTLNPQAKFGSAVLHYDQLQLWMCVARSFGDPPT